MVDAKAAGPNRVTFSNALLSINCTLFSPEPGLLRLFLHHDPIHRRCPDAVQPQRPLGTSGLRLQVLRPGRGLRAGRHPLLTRGRR